MEIHKKLHVAPLVFCFFFLVTLGIIFFFLHSKWWWSTIIGIYSRRMEEPVFRLPLEELAHVRSEKGKLLTKPFLDVCKSVLPVLGIWHVDAICLNLISLTQISSIKFFYGFNDNNFKFKMWAMLQIFPPFISC